jgi:hypothetical protein
LAAKGTSDYLLALSTCWALWQSFVPSSHPTLKTKGNPGSRGTWMLSVVLNQWTATTQGFQAVSAPYQERVLIHFPSIPDFIFIKNKLKTWSLYCLRVRKAELQLTFHN